MIGPSGCGKSTILRALNRMNDLIPGTRVTGTVTFHGQDIYAPEVDPIQVRRRIGMVFQKPNPFPKSIYDNVAYGLRINGIKGKLDDMVEQALTRCRALGRGQGQAQDQRVSHCPEASSSGSASPEPSRCSPR